MMSESGGGVFFPPGATGVTRLIDTGTTGWTAFALMVPALPRVRITVPVFVPSFSAAGS